MKWNTNDEKDPRVVKASDWIVLSAYQKELEARAGVYIFADEAHDVRYIGKAGAGRMIVEGKEKKQEVDKLIFEIYSAKYRKKDNGATHVKVLYTNSDAKALALEQELIKKYDPANNNVDLLNG